MKTRKTLPRREFLGEQVLRLCTHPLYSFLQNDCENHAPVFFYSAPIYRLKQYQNQKSTFQVICTVFH